MAKDKEQAPAPTSREGVISIIGPGMRVAGDCETEGTLRIEGVVEGTVRAGKAVVVGKDGLVQGDINTQDAVIGGRVTGIIPDFLTARENAMTRAQEMIVTHDMHERKRLMFERSDAFVALPGGVGTLEELVEQLTWQQLGRHSKPILLANIDGFWEPLLALLAHMRATAFIRPALAVDVLKAERIDDILPMLRSAAAKVPEADKELAPSVARRL